MEYVWNSATVGCDDCDFYADADDIQEAEDLAHEHVRAYKGHTAIIDMLQTARVRNG